MGGRSFSRKSAKFFLRNQIEIDGYCTSRKYFNLGEIWDGKQIECLEDVLELCKNRESQIDLIVSHMGLTKDLENRLDCEAIHHFYALDIPGMFALSDEPNIYDDIFWKKYRDEILLFRRKLVEDESLEAFDEFVYQKRTASYFKKYTKGVQYFDSPLTWAEDEIFVDCGAFHGETVLDFIQTLKKNGIHAYKKIYVIECDPENMADTRQNLIKFPNIEYVEKGVWRGKSTLRFEGNGTSNSHMGDSKGALEIPVDSIDNILSGRRASFIKMDLEGSEMKALEGARQTILQYKPKLAISVYHKKEDLVEIPKYIYKLRPDYKFYFRNYRCVGNESVLFAV